MRTTKTLRGLAALRWAALSLGASAALTAAAAQTLEPSRERIVRYVREYQGGDCVFVKPRSVTASTAVISGVGAAVAPFRQLDEAFKGAFGFEAMIEIMPIVPAQCPAVTFASHFRDSTDMLRITLKKMAFKRGEPVTGTLQGVGAGDPTLLLVSEDGRVENITAVLAGRGDGASFSLTVSDSAVATRVPYVLVALTGASAADVLQTPEGENAVHFFARLAAANLRLVSDVQSFAVEP